LTILTKCNFSRHG